MYVCLLSNMSLFLENIDILYIDCELLGIAYIAHTDSHSPHLLLLTSLSFSILAPLMPIQPLRTFSGDTLSHGKPLIVFIHTARYVR